MRDPKRLRPCPAASPRRRPRGLQTISPALFAQMALAIRILARKAS